MWQVLKIAVRFVASLMLLFLFGYCEHLIKSGFVVSVLLGAYLYFNGSRLAPWLVVSELIARLYGLAPVSLLCFMVLDGLFLFSFKKHVDDTVVKYRKYEKKIREFLFKKDPSVLHKVDAWLEKYKGREAELFMKINQKYSSHSKDGNDTAVK